MIPKLNNLFHIILSPSNRRRSSTLPSKNPATQKMSSSLVHFFHLIEANDWGKVYSEFLSNDERRRYFQRLASLVEESEFFNGMTLFHACARFNPPLRVVHEIILLCPNAPCAQDCLRRTPLHVMAGTGTPSEIIQVLANAYPDACMIQDVDGRTPLHFACDSSCELFEDNIRKKKSSKNIPSIDTIRVLLEASPDSVLLDDDEGMSAIEFALFSNAELKTVKFLQKATQKIRTRMQEAIQNKRAEEISSAMQKERDLEVQGSRGIGVMPLAFDSTPSYMCPPINPALAKAA